MLVPKSGSSLSSSLCSLLGFCRTIPILQQVHARFILHGLHQNPSLSSDLITCYADLGRLDLSQVVFESIKKRDAFLYNSIIRSVDDPWSAVWNYKQMLNDSLYPDEHVCSFLIRLLASGPWCMENGKAVHSHAIKLGLDLYIVVSDAIEKLYGKHDELKGSTLLTHSNQHVDHMESFETFKRIRLDVRGPVSATVIGLLRNCIYLKCLDAGKCTHALAVVNGLGEDVLVSTALLAMYSSLGSLKMARLLFDCIMHKDSVVWNTMISVYSKYGYAEKALHLLVKMGECGIGIDLFTAIASLSAAAKLRSLAVGKEIHGLVVRTRSDSQVSVHNTLIDMYSKCQNLDYARRVFDMVENKTMVSWTSMIQGYQNSSCHFDAVSLFDQMREVGVKPDYLTLIHVLPSCVHIGALRRVQSIHSYALKQCLTSLTSLVTTLTVTYAKCGWIEMAEKIFVEEESSQKDIISWNAMIGAYSKHGDSLRCFELYSEMKISNVKPDKLTFLGLLTASVNSGLVTEGRNCFYQMVEDYGCQPEKEHYTCMVDLLGRAGYLGEALELINSMPLKPDAQIWGALLSACKLHRDTELAEFAAKRLIDMEPSNAGNFILLSNIYAASGKWDGVAKMRNFLKDRGLKKQPGRSWLEINGQSYEFGVADVSHVKSEDIYTLLRIMEHEIKMNDTICMEVFLEESF